jgi:hypothetical protein
VNRAAINTGGKQKRILNGNKKQMRQKTKSKVINLNLILPVITLNMWDIIS